MRRVLCLPALLLLASAAHAQGEPWYDRDPLPQAMTAAEQARRHEIGARSLPTAPPPGPVRAIAEFERSEAVLVRYPLGIPLALVAALSEHVRVVTLVSGPAQQAQAESAYAAAGVAMANADFLQAPTNSIWTRDYGPFAVTTGDRRVALVDFVYNRPRADDDAVPVALGAHLGVPVYATGLVHTGGNYMAAGLGAAASTDLVWEENGDDHEYVRAQALDYLGVDTYHVTIDPQDSYLKHIDTWGKFLDVDKVMLARVPPTHPRYIEHEAVAAYYASAASPYGTPFQVFRVDTPAGEPYTNALIVNERVYVPIVGSARDAAALDAYRAAMPGYTVRGFTGSWLSTDALHCRVKEVADRGLLAMLHRPPAAEVPHQPALDLRVDIVAHSGMPLDADSLFLVYRLADETPFDTLALAPDGGDTFSASVPVPPGGMEVTYYFSAADASGRTERLPLVGPAGARTVRVRPATVASAPGAGDARLRLDAVAPNPSAGAVTVRYTVGAAGPLTLEVLDALGRRVALLRDGPAVAGSAEARWEPGAAAPGVYVVRLAGRGEQAVRRVAILR